jgi:hypothetical protein
MPPGMYSTIHLLEIIRLSDSFILHVLSILSILLAYTHLQCVLLWNSLYVCVRNKYKLI